MEKVEQGDVLRISGFSTLTIVVSNNLFNETGNVVVCPIVQNAEPGPLHLEIREDKLSGYVLCEQVHYVNLYKRHVTKAGSMDYFATIDLSDAVMGIFDYQTF